MTYLQLINAVLAKLREPQVATVDVNSYVSLIGTFVNEAKREVEDAWNWTILRTDIDIPATTATDIYEINDGTYTAGSRSRILDVYNVEKKWRVNEVPDRYLNELKIQTTQSGSPNMYSNHGATASTGVRKIQLWPFPDGSYTIRVHCVNPQADLSSASDTLSIPSKPVIENAYLRALNERGEDGGRTSDVQTTLYRISLTDAISQDEILHHEETVWHPI